MQLQPEVMARTAPGSKITLRKMHHAFVAIIFCLTVVSHSLQAQAPTYDSLPTRMLEEITIRPTRDNDTLQNFFRANRSATTEDILYRLPGLSLIRRGSYGQEPVLHGMSAGQINLTIDGMKMFGACTDKMDPVSIYVEPQNLEGISVKQSAGSSKMGSTVGGTVDMRLAQPRFSTQRFSGKAGVGYQNVSNGVNAFANGNYATGKSAYNASFNYRRAENYQAGNGEEIAYTQYEKINFAGGGKWRVGHDTLYANVLYDKGWNIGFAALPMDVGSASAGICALTYQRVRSHQFIQNLRIKAYHNRVYHKMDDTHRTNISMHMDMPGKTNTSGLFAEGSIKAIGNHALSFRADVYHNRSLAEMTMYPEGESSMYMQTWPASARTASGFYLADRYKLSAKANINVDARLDLTHTSLDQGIGRSQLEVFYPGVSATSFRGTSAFNLAFRQRLGNAVVATVHGGYGARMPTLSEMYGYYLYNSNDGYDYIGNVNLKPERAFAGDVTFTVAQGIFQLNVSGFYKHLNQYIFAAVDPDISAMTEGAYGIKVYDNIPSAMFTGGDLDVLLNLTSQLQLVSVVKYTYAEDNQGYPLPLIPPLTTLTTVRYARNHWNVQAECEASAHQHRVSTAYGEDQTASYAIVNLRSAYVLKKQKLTVSAGVENLLNTTYHNHLDWANVPRPGRNIYTTLTVLF